LGYVHEELGYAYQAQAKYAESTEAYKEAHRVFLASVGPDNQATRVTGINIAAGELYEGYASKALNALNEQRAWFVNQAGVAGNDSLLLIDYLRARAMLDLSRPAEALKLLPPVAESDAATSTTPLASWVELVQAEQGRGWVMTGRKTEGLALLDRAIAKLRTSGSAGFEVQRLEAVRAKLL
jgi:tetratricopeptide (TPR) repeat protein